MNDIYLNCRGRLRHNLLGKRVEYSSRSVISGTYQSDVWQLGVPRKIALTLTKTEIVNSYNRARLVQCIYVGPNKIGGAQSIVSRQGRVFLIHKDEHKRMRQISMLSNGWKVNRYLQTGDIVLFNRQPTLSKNSFMAHEMYLLAENINTFQLNAACTTPYNADFDGDEMNMHVLNSSIKADIEAHQLLHVKKNIVSCQAGNLIISLIQDGVVGLYLLTSSS